MGLIKDVWFFLKIKKKLWLLPVIIIFVLLGLLIAFTETSVLAPFIYTLF